MIWNHRIYSCSS